MARTEISRVRRNFWEAVAALMGHIIGAGVLGLPFVVSRVGIVIGVPCLILLGLVSMLLNLIIAEVMLRTRYRHQISGLVRKYIGRFGKHIVSLGIALSVYGSLTAYTIGEGNIIASLLGRPDQASIFSLIFLLVSALILYFGLSLTRHLHKWMIAAILGIIFIIVIVGLSHFNVSNLYWSDWSQTLSLYGVVIFSFAGTGSVFTVVEILRGEKRYIKRAIMTASLVPIVLYVLFTLVVVGVLGLSTPEIATVGLAQALGPGVGWLSNVFALLAMFSGFMAVGLSLKQMYRYDYNLPDWLSWLAVIAGPVIVFLFISHDFIEVISAAGSLSFGVIGVLMLLSFYRSRRVGDQKPVFQIKLPLVLGALLALAFIFGLIYTLTTLAS